jgi:hypothetical protein
VNKHIKNLRQALQSRCERTLETLAKHAPPGVIWTRPEGGLNLWISLPSRANAYDFCLQAQNEGISLYTAGNRLLPCRTRVQPFPAFIFVRGTVYAGGRNPAVMQPDESFSFGSCNGDQQAGAIIATGDLLKAVLLQPQAAQVGPGSDGGVVLGEA